MSEKTSSTGAPAGAEAPPAVPARWSAGRKTEVVLRLLRGEPVDMVARETQVPAHELEAWRRVFLTTGTHGLKKQGDPEAREVRRLQAKLGEVMMRLELAEDLLKKGGTGTSGGGMGDERHAESHDGPAAPAHAGVCRLSGAAVDGVYRGRADDGSSGVAGGQAGPPKTPASDETLVAAIRAVLAARPLHGEGHRKVRARLRQQGHRVGRHRV